MMRAAAVAALLACASPALAADAEALFASGQFAAAADAARTMKSVESLTLAARATLVVAAYEIGDKANALRLIDEAEADTNHALALAPGDIGATLQKAIAVGYRAKLKRSPGLAKEARALMEAAAKRSPKNPLAWASIGGWHGEAVAEFGKFIAGTMVGAKTDASIAAYEHAVTLDAGSPAYRTLYAITLIGIGKTERAKLRALLTPAATGRGGDGFDQLMRARARALLAVLEGGDAAALAAAAAKSRAFAALK